MLAASIDKGFIDFLLRPAENLLISASSVPSLSLCRARVPTIYIHISVRESVSGTRVEKKIVAKAANEMKYFEMTHL